MRAGLGRHRRLIYHGNLPAARPAGPDRAPFSMPDQQPSDRRSSRDFRIWRRLLAPYAGTARQVLQIGSGDGDAAASILELLPDARIACIGLFRHEAAFDASVGAFQARVEKVKGVSTLALSDLVAEDRRFDIVYIDGSQRRDDVLIDSLLAWSMLNTDGLLIWNSYRAGGELPDLDRPKTAVDVFLNLHRRELAILHRGRQVAARRRRPEEIPRRSSPREILYQLRNRWRHRGPKPLGRAGQIKWPPDDGEVV
jgi:hypothetical protein